MWSRAARQPSRFAAVASASRATGGASRGKHQARSYLEEYQRSLQKPHEFWAEAAEEVEWFKRYDRVLDEYVSENVCI